MIGRLEFNEQGIDDEIVGSCKIVIEVAPVMEALLRQEDTDGDKRITIDDKGLKVGYLATKL